MKREDIHPSHHIEQSWDLPDPHSPAWLCLECLALACSMCGTDDELAGECGGWRDERFS